MPSGMPLLEGGKQEDGEDEDREEADLFSLSRVSVLRQS